MNVVRTVLYLLATAFAAVHFCEAAPLGSTEEKITKFLWSAPKSAEDRTELIYHDVKDNYNTRITFTRGKEFRRSDGVHGTWHFEGDKLVLTGIDAKDGFTIIFDPLTLKEDQLRGRIPKGRFKGHTILLKMPPK